MSIVDKPMSCSFYCVTEILSPLPSRLDASSDVLKFLVRASLVGQMLEISGTKKPMRTDDTMMLSVDRPYSPA